MSKKSINETTSEPVIAAPVTAAEPVAAASDTPPAAVIWDDSNMRTSYANVCNVVGTREEVTLMFGSNQSWQMDQQQVKVTLNDRIVLNPYMAKRLLKMLEKGVEEYESRFGALAI